MHDHTQSTATSIPSDLLQQRQRAVGLERLAQCLRPVISDTVVSKTAEWMSKAGAFMITHSPLPHPSHLTYSSDVSVLLVLSTSLSACAPSSPIHLPDRLQSG